MSYHTASTRRGIVSPRPSSLYGTSSNLSLLGYSGMSQSSPYLSSPALVNYSPTSYTTYGGTSSGYGSVMVPGISSPSILSSPSLFNSIFQGLRSSPSSRSGSPVFSSSHSYSTSSSPHYGSPNSSRYPSRSSSFNRHQKTYKASKRATSTVSLASSEGYESGADKSGRSSRLDSSVDNEPKQAASPTTPENGEIDYKKLYEESLLENDRLREKLRHVEEDLAVAKSQADKNTLLHKNSLSELEKRERRAMERKLSEMEEELKQLQKLKADNEKLRAENRALTRVVSNITATNNKCN